MSRIVANLLLIIIIFVGLLQLVSQPEKNIFISPFLLYFSVFILSISFVKY